MANEQDGGLRGRHVPIRIYAGGLLVLLALAIGISMTALFYSSAKRAALDSSSQLFDRTAAVIAQEIAAQRSQIALSLEFAAGSELARAPSLDVRLKSLVVLREILAANPWVVAAYTGYDDGDFLLLRRLPDEPSLQFGTVPSGTVYVLQSINREGGRVDGRYMFLTERLQRLGEKADAGYVFDPRERPWYTKRSDMYVTAPYVFFTTHRLGITLSLRSTAGSVFGVDIDLASVSQALAHLLPTRSSQAAVVESDGGVLAFSDTGRLDSVSRTTRGGKAPILRDLGSSSLDAAFAAAHAVPSKMEGSYRDDAGRTWLYRVSGLKLAQASQTGLRALLFSVPEDELLAGAERVRNQAVLLSIGLVILWLPLTLWLSRFISSPLVSLQREAVALRNLDFSDRPMTPSIITEIAAFSDTFDTMRRHIRANNQAATRFVPAEFLRLLERADISSLQLGDHVERTMTILFSDIRSFTSLSESMSPQQTFNFVNSYLTRVGPIIREQHGFIDKYIGDAIMGLFPAHPRDALGAAIAMQKRVVAYNEERARAGYAPISIGIGLHKGELMLGTIGEERRFETTVIADSVNVASRLESLTKTFGALILTSGQVVQDIDPADYCLRRLCDVQVKGASRPIALYEVCDADPAARLAHKRRTAGIFETARLAYASGDFTSAERRFAEVAASDPGDRAAAYFFERARAMALAVERAAWDGVERMESK